MRDVVTLPHIIYGSTHMYTCMKDRRSALVKKVSYKIVSQYEDDCLIGVGPDVDRFDCLLVDTLLTILG
jgi:hypothetical protein